MDPLVLLITTAGLGRFTQAQASDDIDLTIAKVGVTDTAFTVAPTLTALPGEIKRLDAVSGTVVDTSVVHMTVRDNSQDAYGVRGFGLFLADGMLFAVYGSADRIVEKSAVSTTLLALDVAFPAGKIDMIRFGDTNFLYPPATETVRGVARIASDAVADTGTDATSFITPRQLARRILAVFAGRRVATAGLATGGGDLSADRTITVAKASPAEADAGQLDDRAVTPLGLVGLIGRLARIEGRNIFTSGLATGGGALVADRTIAVARATSAEVDAATIDDKAVTPFGLAGLFGRMTRIEGRNVLAAGLATGGGALGADRTITVARASAAEVEAATADDRAVTPVGLAGLIERVRVLVDAVTNVPQLLEANGHIRIPFTPVIIQWGIFTANPNATTATTFAKAFPSTCFAVIPAGGVAGGADSQDNPAVLLRGTITKAGFSVYSADDSANPCNFIAIGI